MNVLQGDPANRAAYRPCLSFLSHLQPYMVCCKVMILTIDYIIFLTCPTHAFHCGCKSISSPFWATELLHLLNSHACTPSAAFAGLPTMRSVMSVPVVRVMALLKSPCQLSAFTDASNSKFTCFDCGACQRLPFLPRPLP